MKYVVEVIYGNRNEWSDEIEYYGDALSHALTMSKLEGVTETRVWFDDEIVDIVVDGVAQEDYGTWDEPNYPYDEWGYDPYTGGFDPDL